MYGQAGFEHGVGVDAQLPVVAPFELSKVLWLEVHRQHVIVCESKRDGIVDRVGHFAPGDFVFDEVLWYEALLLES